MSRQRSREFPGWCERRQMTEAPRSQRCGGQELFCEEAWERIANKLGLSARQKMVARSVVADRSDDDIAAILSLSLSTVKTHMERLHAKLDVHSRVQFVRRIVAAYLAWRAELPPPT
jgi:DNA-binding CsgD family transcriptional regulator